MNVDTAKHMLKSYSGMTHKMTDNNGRPKLDQAIETILNELEKKDKIINLMAERLEHDTEWFFSEFDDYKKQDFIEYFYKKVEG